MKMAVAYFKVLYRNLPVKTEENHEKLITDVSGPVFEPGTFWITTISQSSVNLFTNQWD